MHYKPLRNEKTMNIDLPDMAFQCPANSQLTELIRTRKTLLLLISSQFGLSILIAIAVIHAYVYRYTLGVELYNPIVLCLPGVFCFCFFLGLIAADRYHVKGLRLFVKLILFCLILTYIILAIFIIIPICLKKYPIGIVPMLSYAMSYQIIFCLISLLPGYTVRLASQLAELLMNKNYPSFK